VPQQVLTPCEGLQIEKIYVNIKDIFEGDDLSWFYSTANALKINTKEEVIRRELKFSSGEICDPAKVKESARFLRAFRFLRYVDIKSVKTPTGGVDIYITTQDTWTFLPQVSIISGTGNRTTELGLIESNLRGYGERGELLYKDEENRQTIEAVYSDPRVLMSDYRLLAAVFDRSDGHRGEVSFGKPYRTFLDEDAWDTRLLKSDTVGRLFEGGDERFIYKQKRTEAEASYSLADGTIETAVNRYSLGFRHEDADFSAPSGSDYRNIDVNPDDAPFNPALLASDRTYTGPLFSYGMSQPKFVSRNYIDRFDRVQDYNLGVDMLVTGQIAPVALGSTNDAFLFSLNRASGLNLSENSFFLSEFGVSSRVEKNSIDNSLLRGEMKYYNVLGEVSVYELGLGRHTFATGLALDYGLDLDRDREFLLGADNGLRGYEGRTFYGDKRFVWNTEERVHIADDVFQLLSVGAAAFFDVGATTTGNMNDLFTNRLYSDVGVGLRLAFPRSSGGRVFRIDLAVPVREYEDTNRFDIRIVLAGGQIFSSQLRSEAVGDEAANVSVGFDE